MPRPLRSGLLGLVTVLGLMVTACGSEEPSASDEPDASSAVEPTPSERPSATAQPTSKPPKKPSGTTIDITFEGDEVDPAGVRKKVEAGKPITLHIVADEPGELHVHSSPEQQVAYPAGTSNKSITIEQPGVVEVESHDLDMLVVQLEVR